MDTFKVTPKLISQLEKFEYRKSTYMTNEEVQDEIKYYRQQSKSFKYYFQHPYSRLPTVVALIILNIYLYTEDPIVYSVTHCHIPVLGDIYSFVFANYPPNGYIAAKCLLWLYAIVFGIVVGKIFIHHYLFTQKLQLKIFTSDGQGSWIIILLFTLCVLYYQSSIYNAILLLDGPENTPYYVTKNMHIKNKDFMKGNAFVTWLGEFITAWMILDMMLQDKKYPNWAKWLRKWWVKKWNRVITFWLVCFVLTAIVVVGLSTDSIKWNDVRKHVTTTNELERSFLASAILCIDLIIIMQDWDFPHFSNVGHIKLPGLTTNRINFNLPFCYVHNRKVKLTGKWFNYGVLLIVIVFDMVRWKNQIYYEPFNYGQYADDQGVIYNVIDIEFLSQANTTTLTYFYRQKYNKTNTTMLHGTNDEITLAIYKGYNTTLKGFAFLPFLLTLFVFIYIVYNFSQDEGEQEKVVRRWYESKFIKKRKARKVNPLEPQVNDINDKDDAYNIMDRITPKSFNYVFLHPYLRLTVAYMCVVLCCIHIAEDPIGHSYGLCKVDVIGNAYSLLFTRYPKVIEHVLLKLFIIFCAFISGIGVGKYIIHHIILIGVFKSKLFSNGQGSWVISFVSVIVSLHYWSLVFNEIADALPELCAYKLTNRLNITYKTFTKGVAIISFLTHFTLALMVTDNMLQEKHYDSWAKWVRRKWRHDHLRITVFWLTVLSFTIIAILIISMDFLKWDTMSGGSSNELERSFLSGFIIMFDLVIIMQDWQFPRFKPNPSIKLPGLPNPNLSFKLCCVHFETKGKWFTYGLLGVILVIDIYNFKNQYLYDPIDYKQLTNQKNQIVNIKDAVHYLHANMTRLNETWYDNSNSITIKTTYQGFTTYEKGTSFLPIVIALTSIIVFGIKRSLEIKKAKRTTQMTFQNNEVNYKSNDHLPSVLPLTFN